TAKVAGYAYRWCCRRRAKHNPEQPAGRTRPHARRDRRTRAPCLLQERLQLRPRSRVTTHPHVQSRLKPLPQGGGAARYDFFCGRCQPSMVICLARATVSLPGAASLPITEPAPMVAPSPIVTGATSAVLEPTKAPSPMIVVDLFTPS